MPLLECLVLNYVDVLYWSQTHGWNRFFAGGSFLYTNQSASYVVSPQMALNPNSSYCLTFWYYVIGESSSLAVFVAPAQAYSSPEWSHGKRRGKWTIGEVYLDRRSSIQVFFSAAHDRNRSGLVAIDDVSILDGDCSGGQCRSYLLKYSFNHWSINSLICYIIKAYIHSGIHSFNHSVSHSFSGLFNYSISHSFRWLPYIHLFVYFVHISLIHQGAWWSSG